MEQYQSLVPGKLSFPLIAAFTFQSADDARSTLQISKDNHDFEIYLKYWTRSMERFNEYHGFVKEITVSCALLNEFNKSSLPDYYNAIVSERQNGEMIVTPTSLICSTNKENWKTRCFRDIENLIAPVLQLVYRFTPQETGLALKIWQCLYSEPTAYEWFMTNATEKENHHVLFPDWIYFIEADKCPFPTMVPLVQQWYDTHTLGSSNLYPIFNLFYLFLKYGTNYYSVLLVVHQHYLELLESIKFWDEKLRNMGHK